MLNVLTTTTRRRWRNGNGGVKAAAWRTFGARHHAVKNKRVTVQGPVKKPPMDYMSHRGGTCVRTAALNQCIAPPVPQRKAVVPSVQITSRQPGACFHSAIKAAHNSALTLVFDPPTGKGAAMSRSFRKRRRRFQAE